MKQHKSQFTKLFILKFVKMILLCNVFTASYKRLLMIQ